MAPDTASPHGDRMHNLVRRGWITNQHGAWAMMFVPILVGSLLSGLSWRQALLTVAWLVAFLFFGALSLYVKVLSSAKARARFSGRPRPTVKRRLARYDAALTTYGTLAAAAALALLIIKPSLAWWAIPIGGCFAVALWQMWVGHDRSLLARASAIIASQLMAPIAYSLGNQQGDWPRAWVATLILALYFIGTIPFVKTMIRERGSAAWLRGSLAYHAVLVVAATIASSVGAISWWVTGASVVLLARATAFPLWSRMRSRALSPAIIGITEFAVSAMMVLVLVLPTG